MTDKTIKTIMPPHADNGNGEPVYDKTIVGNMPLPAPSGATSIGNVPNLDGTLHTMRPEASGMMTAEAARDDVFILKGVEYELVKCLSDNSGEAQVYLVRREDKDYVLKVYYPNFNVNKKLLQIIKSFQFEMVVRLYDFGKTYVNAKSRYYELMEYLRGGTLQDYRLKGDFKQFRRLALQGAAALAYCHRHNILHKDIKPSNFFFRDESCQQLVLGDFGISLLLSNDEKVVRTTQARTPLFAAPEMYADVIDGEVEITPAVDYYSLGMTLMALWLGENPMSANERNMMRQKNEGRLPRINELPESVKRIVQGLTSVNPTRRWQYEEVERWFRGENVPVDLSSPVLRYKTFILDPERNIVAENVHDLVPLLLEHERHAINYLYSGSIAEWLETCGNVKLATALKDITENKYPVDKKAGLLAAVYTMEPTHPYEDVQGNLCDDVHSIALSLLGNQNKYALVLQNPNDSLFIWLDLHTKNDINRLRSYFRVGGDPHVTVMRLVYEIDDEIPFLFKHPSGTAKEIVRSFGDFNPSEDDWHSLVDGRLLSWMYSHEDVMACESLRLLTEGKTFSMSLAYEVLYNLDREIAYDLHAAFTPEAVGQLIALKLIEAQHLPEGEFAEKMREITAPDGRFYYYAQMHGWHREIAEANRCFNLRSEENRDRLGAYDLRTAMYRFCRILGAVPGYKLPNGMIITNGRAIPTVPASDVCDEIRNGSFSQWLAVFFHEDPNRDFSEDYSYERELVEWLKALGRYDAKNKYYFRYTKACEETKERVNYVRKEWTHAHNRERLWSYLFYMLSGVWILLVALFGISGKDYLLAHPYVAIMLPVGGMSALIMMSRAYFKGYGATISAFFGGIGLLSSLIPIYALRYVHNHMPGMFEVSIILFTLLYVGICYMTDYRKGSHSEDKAIRDLLKDDDIHSSLLDPLYYTFKTKSVHYQSSKFGVLDDIDNQVHSISGESLLHYVLWNLLVLILIGEFVAFSPRLLNLDNPDFGDTPVATYQENEQEQIIVE